MFTVIYCGKFPGSTRNLPFTELTEPVVGYVAHGKLRPKSDILRVHVKVTVSGSTGNMSRAITAGVYQFVGIISGNLSPG